MNFRYNVRYQPLDQVNLIFRGLDNSQRLLEAVLRVLDQGGWGYDIQEHLYLLEHDDWLRYETAWKTHGHWWDRYHVRFWQGASEILASAHKERLKMWLPGHEVESFDDGKREAEAVFRNAGWLVQPDAHDLRQQVHPIADPPASGRASVMVHP